MKEVTKFKKIIDKEIISLELPNYPNNLYEPKNF